jgi:interferon gamma-inducible protein 30
MLSCISLPGRLAALMVVCFLVQGLFCRNNLWNSHTSTSSTAESSSSVDATLKGTTLFHRSTSTITSTSTSSSPAVQVSVYVEALCIYSKGFFNEQLVPTYDQLGSQVMDVKVVVFGNARIDLTNKTLQCQHGEAECDANTFDQCAVDIYPYPDRYLPYLTCLFNSLPMGKQIEPFSKAVFASCARHAAMDAHALQQCRDDPERAWKLQKQAAAMNPSQLDHVPWVELNGEYMDLEEDLLASVCQLYMESGGTHPACSSHTEAVSVRVA